MGWFETLLGYLPLYQCEDKDDKFSTESFSSRSDDAQKVTKINGSELDNKNGSSGAGYRGDSVTEKEIREYYNSGGEDKEKRLGRRRLLRLAGLSAGAIGAGLGVGHTIDKVLGREAAELKTSAEVVSTNHGMKEIYEVTDRVSLENVNGVLELEEDQDSFEAECFEYGLGLQTHVRDLDDSPVAIVYKDGGESFNVEYYDGEKDLGPLHPDLEFKVDESYKKDELADSIYEKAKNESVKDRY